ncbi:MAG: biotin--[acetyl-CoA-carboxylase] ligase [Pirellulales bacterium]
MALDDVDIASLGQQAGFATIELHNQLGSTMERARVLAAAEETELPALILTDYQTSGFGRRGSGWWQERGSLAVSIVLDNRCVGLDVQPIWSLICGLALADALGSLEPSITAYVKWPNDVEIDGAKIAGLLLETVAFGRAILGIGVNTNGSRNHAPSSLHHRIITLPDLTGRTMSRTKLLETFMFLFLDFARMVRSNPIQFIDRYQARCNQVGRPVKVYRSNEVIEGFCAGIAQDGSLIVDTVRGRQRILSGSLRSPDEKC